MEYFTPYYILKVYLLSSLTWFIIISLIFFNNRKKIVLIYTIDTLKNNKQKNIKNGLNIVDQLWARILLKMFIISLIPVARCLILEYFIYSLKTEVSIKDKDGNIRDYNELTDEEISKIDLNSVLYFKEDKCQ